MYGASHTQWVVVHACKYDYSYAAAIVTVVAMQMKHIEYTIL